MNFTANTSTINEDIWLECGANWTGHVIGEPKLLGDPNPLKGYLAVLVTVIFYGCAFVPLKFVSTKDGFFSQWIMCSGIWLVGIIIQLIRGMAPFYPLVVLNGVIWAIGNCCVAPIINLIGLAIGMLLWNCTNIFLGWASGRFGFFQVCPQIPHNPVMNYIGVALCLIAAVAYGFVKTESKPTIPNWFKRRRNTEDMQLHDNADPKNNCDNSPSSSMEDISHRVGINADPSGVNPSDGLSSIPAKLYGAAASTQRSGSTDEELFLGTWPETWRKAFGMFLALFSGCCYGVLFVATSYIQDHIVVAGRRASQSGLDYAFTLYSGIYMASTIFFVAYYFVVKTPYIEKTVVVPAFICGIMWGIATAGFLVANEVLSAAVTFPIVGTVPGVISIIWGIALFKEIRGLRNYLVLAAAFALTLIGVVMAALSKTI